MAGFKLDTLLKLADVKGTDRKTSLLHFVLDQLLKDSPAMLTLPHQLASVKPAANLQVCHITSASPPHLTAAPQHQKYTSIACPLHYCFCIMSATPPHPCRIINASPLHVHRITPASPPIPTAFPPQHPPLPLHPLCIQGSTSPQHHNMHTLQLSVSWVRTRLPSHLLRLTLPLTASLC